MLQRFKKKNQGADLDVSVCVVVIQGKLQQICCSSYCEKNGRQRVTVTCPRSLTGYLCQHNDGPQSFLGPVFFIPVLPVSKAIKVERKL